MMLQRSTSCEGKARSRATKQGRVTGPGDPESAVCRDTRAHAGRVGGLYLFLSDGNYCRSIVRLLASDRTFGR